MIILKNSQIQPLSTCAHNGQIHYLLAHNAQDSVFSWMSMNDNQHWAIIIKSAGCYDDYAQCSNPLIITVHYSMFNLHSAHVLPKK